MFAKTSTVKRIIKKIFLKYSVMKNHLLKITWNLRKLKIQNVYIKNSKDKCLLER